MSFHYPYTQDELLTVASVEKKESHLEVRNCSKYAFDFVNLGASMSRCELQCCSYVFQIHIGRFRT